MEMKFTHLLVDGSLRNPSVLAAFLAGVLLSMVLAVAFPGGNVGRDEGFFGGKSASES